jgi:hypothetical protein
MRRLAEKPANVTFMLRSLMKEGTAGTRQGSDAAATPVAPSD